MTFPDHFSKQSSTYARSRPRYPRELFDWLAQQVPSHDLSWDCACGNGQAALSLVEYFDRVIATDASEEQIRNAFKHPRVDYRVALAEDSGIESASVDLITVATALHWFDEERFYREADRVLKPGGILAVWTYAGTRATPGLQKAHDTFAFETLLDYWSEGAKRNWMKRYEDVVLPFNPIAAPEFHAKENWTIDQLMDYLNSWSAVQTFKDRHGVNPVDNIRSELLNAWGDAPTRELTWELLLKVSRKGVDA